jgi:phosphatidylglycerophosphatase A
MKFNKVIATAFGLGYAPIAPGTFGALGAYLLNIFLIHSTHYNLILGINILIFMMLGVYVSFQLEAEWGSDPSRIVIDEVVGMWIATIFLPANFYVLLTAFILFRFFDIYKPFGIRFFDNLKNGWGVMLDDVLAGIYANILLQAILFFKILEF